MRALLAALLLVSVLPLAAAGQQTRGLEVAGRAEGVPATVYASRIALVVGIDEYEAPSLRLKNARRGADSIAAVLRDEFGFDRVITLYDAEATREAVLGVLAELRSTDSEDALLIYWAGHGTTLRTSSNEELGYLVPWDGALDGDAALGSNISMEEIRSVVGLAIPARHKFLVVDACYGGLLTMRGGARLPPEDEVWLGGVLQRDVFQILTAGEADQAVLDTGPNGQSVFTGRFLEVLGETKDYITATELAAAVQRRVRADAWTRGGHVQTPAFGRLAGTGDFVLLREAAAGTSSARPGPQRSRGLTALAVASLSAGVAGMVAAGMARQRYVAAPLGDPTAPGLLATNRGAGVAGVTAVSAGVITLGAAFVVAEW